MNGWFQGMQEIVGALAAGDTWMLGEAMRHPVIWPAGLVALLIFASIILMMYRYIPWAERNLEQSLMVVSYLAIGGIIFVEVIRRFVFQQQAPWSSTLPPVLFLIMTWFGCSYNVKLRTHLAFSEFRSNFPRVLQMGCLVLDALLWTGFAWVVFVTSVKMVVSSASNFQYLQGTDNIMVWWFLIAVPLAFTTLVARVLENLLEDVGKFRRREKLIEQAVIGGN